jgi:hypothetical protein
MVGLSIQLTSCASLARNCPKPIDFSQVRKDGLFDAESIKHRDENYNKCVVKLERQSKIYFVFGFLGGALVGGAGGYVYGQRHKGNN